MTWTHRTSRITHGRDGWALLVADERWLATIAEEAVEAVMAALGHPCCGRGPLAHLRLRYRTLHKLGLPVDPEIVRCGELDENALDYFWFKVINLPNRFYIGDRAVADIPLSEEQAERIAPEFVSRRRIPDDDELVDEGVEAAAPDSRKGR